MLRPGLSKAAPSSGSPPELWLYLQTNLLPNENIDKLDALFARAAKAGYSHILLADYKTEMIDVLGVNSKPYLANVERVKKLAARDHLQIVPSLFSIGYSNALLAHDPNLAEGLPVVDTPMIVKGNVATVVRDPAIAFDKLSFKDDVVALHDGIAEVSAMNVNARLVYKITVPTFRCFHVHVEAKTDDFHGDARVAVLDAKAQPLCHQNAKIQPTKDWSPVDIIFDSLDQSELSVYFGIWGGSKGKLQWRNWSIEEIGPLNVLRRAGTPCTVKRDGKLLHEGTDYDRIEDPKLGNQPWEGSYTAWHEAPTIRTHNLADDTTLAISWYYPPIVMDEEVAICPSEAKTNQVLATVATAVKKAWGTSGYMMAHDEDRCANWDLACQSRKLDAGQILAENVRRCTTLLGGSNIYVWSDMFDPNHNAVDHYYLTRGNNAGSWEGLDRKVIVVNWNYDKRDTSSKFFADRGNRQLIAGYYDADVNQIKYWKASAANVKGVVGFMYTTWSQNYGDLETFAKLVRE